MVCDQKKERGKRAAFTLRGEDGSHFPFRGNGESPCRKKKVKPACVKGEKEKFRGRRPSGGGGVPWRACSIEKKGGCRRREPSRKLERPPVKSSW